MPIDVLPLEKIDSDEVYPNSHQGLPIKIRKKHVVLKFPNNIAGKDIHLYVGDKFYGTFTVNDNGEIMFKKNTKIGKDIRSKAERGLPFTYKVLNKDE